MSSDRGNKAAQAASDALLYQRAETAAQWMERGDDVAEAQAIRQLIAEHRTLREAAHGANVGR